ncbi:hypothetical protein E2562_010552 [Oryza meyeriana var. granulata]|uniref:Protein kinase domain-containing protein n=1 Tax=Oryza meyeriana var. granulata TaxID=110450 RepID=A0A6G1BTX0_9ORYZ|nr:hypothetical protein E2562_010552 [Oryza meyeriana var. granulata]
MNTGGGGSGIGTLLYTSLEQLSGDRNYGMAVDIWALGYIMGELLTGVPLFEDYDTDEEDLLAEVLDRLGSTGACKLFLGARCRPLLRSRVRGAAQAGGGQEPSVVQPGMQVCSNEAVAVALRATLDHLLLHASGVAPGSRGV